MNIKVVRAEVLSEVLDNQVEKHLLDHDAASSIFSTTGQGKKKSVNKKTCIDGSAFLSSVKALFFASYTGGFKIETEKTRLLGSLFKTIVASRLILAAQKRQEKSQADCCSFH